MLETTTGATINTQCLVCPRTYENLISVLNCASGPDAILFDDQHAYLVQKTAVKFIKQHLVSIADVADNEYILRIKRTNNHNHGKLSRKSSVSDGSATSNTIQHPTRLILRMKNPRSNSDHRVTVQPPRKRPRTTQSKSKSNLKKQKTPTESQNKLDQRPVFTSPSVSITHPDEPEISSSAAQWHQILNHAPAKTLREMALNPDSVVPSEIANELPSQLT